MNSQLWVLFAFLIAAAITAFILYFIKFPDPTDAAGAEEIAAASDYLPAKAKAKPEPDRMVYTTEDVLEESRPSDGGCAICLDEYGVGERRATVDACGHRFHALCIEAWLRNNSTCPLCRHLLV